MFEKLRAAQSRRRTFAIAGVIAVIVALMASGSSVSAQGGPSGSCSGTTTDFGTDFFGSADGGNRLLSTSPTTRTFALSAPLPAGTYAINAVSYDGYDGRDQTTAQPEERWFAHLLAADGTELAMTGTTGDLTDGVTEATWSGSIGEVTIDQPATSIRVSHAAPGAASPNSVRATCVGATAVVEEIPSSVTVNFEDEADQASTIGLVCVNGQESQTGRIVQIAVTEIPGGTSCTVTYPQRDECTVTITPTGLDSVLDDDGLMVAIPPEGGVDVIVRIVCTTDSDGSTDSSSTDESTDGTTDSSSTDVTTDGSSNDATNSDASSTTEEVTTEVAGQVETQAGAAQPQPGTPSFTG
ncbi:MAG: hypothetical protein ACR2P0_04525 [Acidimicrobiales bacterium]